MVVRRSMVLVLLGCSAASAAGQNVERDYYYAYLPPMPRIVAQTSASAAFALYGDTAAAGYRDQRQPDGIDDTRAQRLLALAVRFAPILRRNNRSVPVDFREPLQYRPVLHVDTWSRGRRVGSDSVLLYDASSMVRSGTDGHVDTAMHASDSLLARLVHDLHPDGLSSRIVRPEQAEERVLFFDFPGTEPRSWRRANGRLANSRIYAHFFVHEQPASSAAERYSFVIQYWFFYPFNDAANNHEGDWEHIAVRVTTKERANQGTTGVTLLTQEEVRRILDEQEETIMDSLVIAAVEYYFHESVMVIDYLDAYGYEPRSRMRELSHLHIWEQTHFVTDAIARRLRAEGGALATHPIGYIGGNNKGPDELTTLWPRFGGSFNRNGHGTYPFAGRWRGVGPVGATEQVSGRIVPERRSARVGTLEDAFVDSHFMAYDSADITLMPDWERVKDFVRDDPVLRREWAWLLLPIRWGFPVSASPGAGLMQHVDVGQVAPETPTYQPGWNRLAEETGLQLYDPHVLRSLTPLTPWDRLISGWGVLNVPVALLGFFPGWNILLTQLGPWLTTPLEILGIAPATIFTPRRLPYRFTSSGFGVHRQFSGGDFALFLPQPGDSALPADLLPPDSHVDRESMQRDGAHGLQITMNLHYGPRFTVQNAYARSSSRIAYVTTSAAGSSIDRIAGTLEMQELTGGFRLRLTDVSIEAAQLYVGGGWGWTWYTLRHVAAGNTAIDLVRKGGYPPSFLPSARWWPNTWYGEAGVELMVPRSVWLLDRIGYGLDLHYTGTIHRLGATAPGSTTLGRITRNQIGVGLVLSWD